MKRDRRRRTRMRAAGNPSLTAPRASRRALPRAIVAFAAMGSSLSLAGKAVAAFSKWSAIVTDS